jgi:hypothetical protein
VKRYDSPARASIIVEKELEFFRTSVNTGRWVFLPRDVPMVGGASKRSHASIMIGKLEVL